MTTCRYRCPFCTAYLVILDDEADGAFAGADQAMEAHRCGLDRLDGVEDEREFALNTPA